MGNCATVSHGAEILGGAGNKNIGISFDGNGVMFPESLREIWFSTPLICLLMEV